MVRKGRKKATRGWLFSCKQRITWLQMRQQQEQMQQEQMRQQQALQRVQVQQLERELLLFYHRRPKRRQRSRLPKREICSFLKVE